jgi:GT2 family glycosyltransferase
VSDNPNISLSIAAVCYQTQARELRELFESILDAVEKLRDQFDCEFLAVYLIDNSENEHLSLDSLADSQPRAKALNVELRLLHGHGNNGYGSGHNRILRSLATYHLMLNSDIVLGENSLVTGITFLENNADTCIVSPNARDKNGNKQYLCKRYPSVLTFLLRGFAPRFLKGLFSLRLARYEMHDLSEDEPTSTIPIASGCFMLCRSDALVAADGFDEGYFLYFEDFDLSLRLADHGKIAYVPAVRIVHGGGHAARKGFAHIKMFTRSGIRFFNRHGWRWVGR